MQKKLSLFLSVIALSTTLHAQIKVEFFTDKSSFDYYEDVLIGVKLTNIGDQVEGIGKYNTSRYFDFYLEDNNGNDDEPYETSVHGIVDEKNQRRLLPNTSAYVIISLSYLYGDYDQIFSEVVFNKSGKFSLKSKLYPECNINFESAAPTEKSKKNIQLVHTFLTDKIFKENELKKGEVLNLPQIKRILPKFIRNNLKKDDTRLIEDDNCAYNLKYLIRKYGDESFFLSKCIEGMWYFSQNNPKKKKVIKNIIDGEIKWKKSKNKASVTQSLLSIQ